jgi:hypothetical protein
MKKPKLTWRESKKPKLGGAVAGEYAKYLGDLL